jgi:hypothetical protein
MWESIGHSPMRDVPLVAIETGGRELEGRNGTACELREFSDLLAGTDCLDWDNLHRRLPDVASLLACLEGTPDATA